MADLKTTVDLIFKGTDQASASINSISTGLKGFNKNLQDITGPLANLSKSVLALEGVLIGTAIVLGKTAFDAAVKYQSSLIELEKVYSDQSQTIEEFKAQVADLGRVYGISGVVALESATDFIKAGNDAAEALKLTALSLELAEAAQVDYKLATETVTIASKAFGLEADDLRTKFDFLNTAVDTSAVSGAQLVEAFGGAASAAGAAGLTFEQYVARLIPGIERTQETTEVARALRGVFVSLIRPTAEQAEVLGQLGVALEDGSGNATLARDRIGQFFDVVQNSTGAQRELTLAVVGGKDQFDRLSAVVGGTQKTQELLNLTTDDYITLQSEFERRAASSEFAVEKLRNAFGALNTTIGQQTQDNVDGVIGSLINLSEALNQAIANGALEDVFDAIGAELDQLSTIIGTIADNLPEALEGVDFSALATSIGDLGESIRGFFGVDLSTTEGLRTAIQGIVDGITALQNITVGIIESLSVFVQGFIALAQAGSDTSAETQKLIGNVLGFAQGLNTVIPLVNALLTALIALTGVKALGGLAPLVSGATGAITALVASLGSAGLLGVSGAVGFAFGSLINEATGLSGKIADLAAEVTGLADRERALLAPTDAITAAQSEQLEAFQSLTAEYQALLDRGEKLTPELVNQAKAFLDTGAAVDLTREEFEALLAQSEIEQRMRDIAAAAVDAGEGIESAGKASGDAADNIKLITDIAEKLGISFEDASIQIEAMRGPAAALAKEAREQAEAWVGLKDSITELVKAQAGQIPFTDELVAVWRSAEVQAILYGKATAESASAMAEYGLEAEGLSAVVQNVDGVVGEFVDGIATFTQVSKGAIDANRTTKETLDDLGESGEIAKDKYAELRVELEKAAIEARVEFDIAELENQTEQVKAQIDGVVELAQIKATIDIAEIEAGVEKTRLALEGLQNVFDVTGNSISELIDAIAGVDDADKFARNKIEIFQNALDRQITLQEAALESQIKVNNATIRELDARAKRLRSGEALITIDGGNLEPELEAFMFRILENIQLRANADGQAFLLGI